MVSKSTPTPDTPEVSTSARLVLGCVNCRLRARVGLPWPGLPPPFPGAGALAAASTEPATCATDSAAPRESSCCGGGGAASAVAARVPRPAPGVPPAAAAEGGRDGCGAGGLLCDPLCCRCSPRRGPSGGHPPARGAAGGCSQHVHRSGGRRPRHWRPRLDADSLPVQGSSQGAHPHYCSSRGRSSRNSGCTIVLPSLTVGR